VVGEHWANYKASLVESLLADQLVRRRGAAAVGNTKLAVLQLKPMAASAAKEFYLDTEAPSEGEYRGGGWADDGFRTPVSRDECAYV